MAEVLLEVGYNSSIALVFCMLHYLTGDCNMFINFSWQISFKVINYSIELLLMMIFSMMPWLINQGIDHINYL